MKGCNHTVYNKYLTEGREETPWFNDSYYPDYIGRPQYIWIDENISGWWFTTSIVQSPQRPTVARIYFELKEDLILFKLAWL